MGPIELLLVPTGLLLCTIGILMGTSEHLISPSGRLLGLLSPSALLLESYCFIVASSLVLGET